MLNDDNFLLSFSTLKNVYLHILRSQDYVLSYVLQFKHWVKFILNILTIFLLLSFIEIELNKGEKPRGFSFEHDGNGS